MVNWDNIVAQHGPLVWRTAYRLVGCDADAADCYQEAFAAALLISRRAGKELAGAAEKAGDCARPGPIAAAAQRRREARITD